MERSDASARRRYISIGAGFLLGIATILSWPNWVGRELATSGELGAAIARLVDRDSAG